MPRSRSLPLLEKKLNELETVLSDALRRSLLDPDTASDSDPDHFHHVNKRFVFLQKLLSAELASHPETSDQLRQIERRLAGLKVAIHDWSQPRNREAISSDDAVSSVCSDCTQALLYDDFLKCGHDDSPIAHEEEENFCCEKLAVKSSDCTEEKVERMMEEEAVVRRPVGGISKYCGAFGCGVIMGAIFVVVLVEWFPVSLQFIEYEAFVVPPT